MKVRPSELLRTAIAEARTLTDPAANVKLARRGEVGRRSRARDDALAEAILAVGVGHRAANKPRPRLRYFSA